MELMLYQVDAFAVRAFEGNPAAIVPLTGWLPDPVLQAIALENNLSETAYFVRRSAGQYDLRWFTPAMEVDLCGHATLASAHVLFAHLGETAPALTFHTRSGPLHVSRGAGGPLTMDFPALPSRPLDDAARMAARVAEAMNAPAPLEVFAAPDLMAVFESAAQVRALSTRNALAALLQATQMRGLIATAPSDDPAFDFVSRFFAPNHGIPEDPVTGSAHCKLAPYWGQRLGKTQMTARQVSPRGGTVLCTLTGDRVLLGGRCADFMTGTIRLPD